MQKLCCLSFLKKDLFDVDHFKVFIEFVTILLLFYVFCVLFFFKPLVCEILVPQTEPAVPSLQSEILTTGLPGKSQKLYFLKVVNIRFWKLHESKSDIDC